MSELERYQTCMDHLHAPEALVQEVWNMTERKERIAIYPKRTVLILAAIVALMAAFGIVTYAAGPSIFGWGNNFEVKYTKTESGVQAESILHTDSLVDPVEIENGRLCFIVNGEHTDITELISETQPYLYDYTDDEGIVHYWIVGKNGPEPELWGYAEYLYNPGEDWVSGYTARTNLDPDGTLPVWLEAGKAQLVILTDRISWTEHSYAPEEDTNP